MSAARSASNSTTVRESSVARWLRHTSGVIIGCPFGVHLLTHQESKPATEAIDERMGLNLITFQLHGSGQISRLRPNRDHQNAWFWCRAESITLRYRKRERRSSIAAATAITAVVLPVLLVYNLTLGVPATVVRVEAEPAQAQAEVPVVQSAVDLGVSIGSGTAELLAAFQEAFPPVTVASERPIADAAPAQVRDPEPIAGADTSPTPTTTTSVAPTTTTTTAPPTTTTVPVTTAAPTTAAPTTTIAVPPTTAAPTTTIAVTTTTVAATTTTVAEATSPIAPYPWKDSWPEVAMWEKLAFCESTGDWNINSGNGYYGGIQFTQLSWEFVGGSGRPDRASREEQIYRGALLWELQSWNAWPGCTTRRFGWGARQTTL